MKDSIHALVYAAAMGAICALLLTGAAELTADAREANRIAEEYRNILGVLNVPVSAGASSAELKTIFEKNVRRKAVGELETYEYVSADGNSAGAVAVAFAGPGLWGPIKGFLALEPDLATIRGIAFHEQEETPGLGGEIASDKFRSGFVGKRIRGADGEPGIVIRADGAVDLNQVDAITGATMTCDKVEQMINEVIVKIAAAAQEQKQDGR